MVGNKGARWPGSSGKDRRFYVSLWLDSRHQAWNLCAKPSGHHPLKCFSEVAGSLSPGFRGAQADFTRPWFFPPRLDHHYLSHCLMAFILAMGAAVCVSRQQFRLPNQTWSHFVSGRLLKVHTPLRPHLLTLQPTVVFPST